MKIKVLNYTKLIHTGDYLDDMLLVNRVSNIEIRTADSLKTNKLCTNLLILCFFFGWGWGVILCDKLMYLTDN